MNPKKLTNSKREKHAEAAGTDAPHSNELPSDEPCTENLSHTASKSISVPSMRPLEPLSESETSSDAAASKQVDSARKPGVVGDRVRSLFDKFADDEAARKESTRETSVRATADLNDARSLATLDERPDEDKVSPPENAFPDLLIRASAGTGKTFQLSNRYLQLIFQGWRPDRILATTFTRKAAGEIMDRVLYRVAKAAESPDGVAQLSNEINMPLSLTQCRDVLRQLTRHLHRLRIGTLDAFFLQAAQMLSLELGLPPGWDLTDETDDRLARQLALTRLLESGAAATSLGTEAGAGAPKRSRGARPLSGRSDLRQLIHWLAHGETNRSVQSMLNDAISGMYSTFLDSDAKAWMRLGKCVEIDPAETERAISMLEAWEPEPGKPAKLLCGAVRRTAQHASDENWGKLLKETLVANVVNGSLQYSRKEIPAELVPHLQQVADRAAAELRNRYILQTQASYELLERFHTQYEAAKNGRRRFNFDDLPRYLAEGVRAAEVRRLNFRMDAGVDALLLDEFQDTSRSQWQVIRQLALRDEVYDQPSTHSPDVAKRDGSRTAKPTPTPRSFLCVGDTKQAIYGWRGGDAALLDAIEHEVPSVEPIELNQSYRSSPVVIDLVNRVNKSISTHPDLGRATAAARQWSDQFPEHSTARTELAGYVSLETVSYAENVAIARDRCLEAAAKRIALIRSTTPDRSVAVLVRKNELVASSIFELQRLGVAASEEGGNPLTDSAAVQLIISLLQLADFPQDRAALFHLQQSTWANDLSLPRTTENESLDTAARRLAERVTDDLFELGYGAAVSKWCDQLRKLGNEREQRRLAQLVDLAYRFEREVEAPRSIGYLRQNRISLRPAAFLQRIQDVRFSDPTEDPVRVMTVHQAKGLQFDIVVIPDLTNRLVGQTPTCVAQRSKPQEPLSAVSRYIRDDALEMFPPRVRKMHDQHLDDRVREELCVLYVALTRAVHSVQMFVAANVPPENTSDGEAGELVGIQEDVSGQTRSKNTRRGKSASPDRPDATYGGLIRHALIGDAPLPPNKCLFEIGDVEWMYPFGKQPDRTPGTHPSSTLDDSARVDSASAARPRQSRSVTLAERSTEGDGKNTVRPSALEGGGRVRLRERLGVQNQAAMRRGTLIHAFFEQIHWLDEGLPTNALLETIGLSIGAQRSEVKSAIKEFQAMLTQPSIRAILSRDTYQHWPPNSTAEDGAQGELEARCEQAVSVATDGGRLSGNIDRLVIRYAESRSGQRGRPIAANVLDFKTDGVHDEAQRQQLVEHYRPQLDAYRMGVSKLLHLDVTQIDCQLIMLSTGEVVRVD